ncbi:MAG: right-handed parallel beta-helix repeat-containing protein [Planctomycetes bacterium]|nr:right-handed parallel beta-helix repeat-containing protein [Planctomycetota bacterium]
MTRPRCSYLALFLGSAVMFFADCQEAKHTNKGDAMDADYYVATNGNDAWSGKLPEPNADKTDGPFATLTRAQQAVRETKGKPVTVLIRGGVYRLSEPIRLRAEDSGTEEGPITYVAYPGEKPIFSGGRAITGWKKSKGNIWTAQIDDVKNGTWYFRQLFINSRRATRARSPNEGFFKVKALADKDNKPGVRWNKGVDAFKFRAGDIKAWTNLNEIEVIVFHSWNTSRMRIASVDENKHLVTFTAKTCFRPLAWDPNQRYYVENAPDALDSPGEWVLDRQTGALSYWPLPGEDMTKAEVVAPVVQDLVRFEGEAETGLPVQHIRLVGLSFQHADWDLPAQGYNNDPQAAVTIPAAVMLWGALHCTIEKCEIAHVGKYGLWVAKGSKHNRIVQNHIHDLGAGGVRVGDAKMAAKDVNEASHNLIHNNYIHDGGHIYPEGVGFWLAQSSHNTISHNEIHSFNYSGMSVGWNWNEAKNRTDHNVIEHNHVHHVVRGMLSDGGGIYTLGTQTGTVIRNNVYHDIFPYMGRPAMAWGIYFDQGSNSMLVENNIVYNTLTGGLMNTGRNNNTVRNNIFALSGWNAVWRYTRAKGKPSTVERNLFYLTQGELFHMDGGQSDFETKWDHNLYWRTDGKPLLFYEDTFAEWQAKGVDQHSIVADPNFVDAEHYDFRLQPDSPAIQLGFQPIDTSKNGLVGDSEWVNLPKKTTFAKTILPPPPPEPEPVNVDDGFEDTDVGQPPKLAKSFEEGEGGSVRVTDKAAATGKHSLKFTDSPGMKHVWDPHMFYSPNFREGRADLSFDIRVEPGAVVGHEWRDQKHPYRVGPSLLIKANGEMLANGMSVMAIPHGQWVHIEMHCELGSKANGKYDLIVTLPGGQPQSFPHLDCGSAKFKRLHWLGFTSQAKEKAVYYLDNIKLDLPDR